MSNESAPHPSDILEFMALRAPRDVPANLRGLHYIHDRTLSGDGETQVVTPTPILSPHSPSPVAARVHEVVLVQGNDMSAASLGDLLPRVVVDQGENPAAEPGPPGDGGGAMATAPGVVTYAGVGDRATFEMRGGRYLVPDRVADIPVSGIDTLLQLRQRLDALHVDATLADALAVVRDVLRFGSLRHAVLGQGGDFGLPLWSLWRALFDRLYLLYALRCALGPVVVVRHAEVIAMLQVLHVIENLAIDDVVQACAGKDESVLDAHEAAMLRNARALRPALRDWLPGESPAPAAVVADMASLRALLRALPAIHPVFSRGRRYLTPFNTVKPVGVGDLKVVRQRLVGYSAGEVSYIHNVLMGERRERRFRRLEKSEDTFVGTSERSEETVSEHQVTDRFELRRDAEDALKQTLGLTANASVTYRGTPVVATATTGFSFQSAAEESSKTAEMLAREAVAKSVSRVTSRMVEQRTSVRLLETEETNTQEFDAKEATSHISGVYRWVDKTYEAQLWNVGRRMMFEFIVPEPAHFLVESRLRAYAQHTPLPDPPVLELETVQVPHGITGPDGISDANYEKLALRYDLSALPKPQRLQERRGFLADAATGQQTVYGHFPGGVDVVDGGQLRYRTHSYRSAVNLPGYRMTKLRLRGSMKFHVNNNNDPGGRNILEVFVDGRLVAHRERPDELLVAFDEEVDLTAPPSLPALEGEVEVTLGMQDAIHYSFTLGYVAARVDDGLDEWRRQVYHHVHRVEQQRVDDANRRLRAQYEADLAAFNAEMAEFRARSASDILQGRSGLLNARVINEELKKHCLALLAREFDTVESDDRLSQSAIGVRRSANTYPVFIEPGASAPLPRRLSLSLRTENSVDFPAIDIAATQSRAPRVQFLEQAFEWTNLAHIFYPYYWGAMPRWVELMNRFDAADPLYTAFLQAGSCRVLLAATPGYEDAVLHFLATGMPWEGGPAPVIDDPLFLPVHDEIRRQQQAGADGTPEGKPWTFVLPTSLVYLQDSTSPLPVFERDE